MFTVSVSLTLLCSSSVEENHNLFSDLIPIHNQADK
ncbi:hypothetical protein FKN05_09840 [Vibrio sp. 1-1(7)]|nr:hypothetical protein [Vibrio sp. 1-1(7)]NNN72347.1 hypothetical protein [Vibrio sp. 12-2(3-a)]